jgi:hypothetical protein
MWVTRREQHLDLAGRERHSKMDSFKKLLRFLDDLEERKIFYRLSRVRPETIMVEVAVPGERWEVELFADGTVEVEVFRTTVGLQGEEALKRLFDEFSD